MVALPAHEPTGHRDGAFGLWRREGRVLLVQNDRVVGGCRVPVWDLPGGTVRPGERLDDALVREWHEETGLGVRVGSLLLVVDGAKRREEGAPPLYTWRAFTFAVLAEGEPTPGRGVGAVAWVPEAELADRLDAPYHAALRVRLSGGEGTYGSVSWVEAAPPPVRADDGFRRLLALGAAAALGDRDGVAREGAASLEAGENAPRIEECLLQVVPYAGFPRALAAFGVLRPLLGRARGLGDGQPGEAESGHDLPAARGRATFGRVYGETAERVESGLGALHPALPAWTLEFAYGRVLSRPVLSLLERELLAVALLAALGNLDEALLGHMRAAVRVGASAPAVAAAADVGGNVAGEARREAARALLGRL